MFITLHGVDYIHSNHDVLFKDLGFTINRHDKVALIGNNGVGKSTLLRLIAGRLRATGGQLFVASQPYYVPQLTEHADITIAEAIGVADKVHALHKILAGNATDEALALLHDDWGIEERCREALAYWGLDGVGLTQRMNTLSGGQRTKVYLAGIMIHKPEIVLLDEPSNHLDSAGREILYRYIATTAATLVVVSHDRVLLNLLSKVYELAKGGVTVYGGNYDFYAEQKAIERHALDSVIQARTKELRKAKEVERAALERQQKLDARGKKKQEKAGLPTILMKTFKNSGEKTIARLKGAHADKVHAMSRELSELREDLPAIDEMKIDFDNSPLHRGKMLVTAEGINFGYDDHSLWPLPLDFKIVSGERIAVRGRNGSGKTTLIKLIIGELSPSAGVIVRADASTLYIDQDYSLLDELLTVYEQAQRFNSGGLQEHEVKIRLNRFLFGKAHWDKPCYALSGGERMRLILCALAIRSKALDMLILDEPTNNLDIQNVQILTKAINEYEGTVLVISHDDYFVKEIGVDRVLELSV